MKCTTTQQDLFPDTYKALLATPAGENTPARLVYVALDKRETAYVTAFASRCGMTLDAFVRAYMGAGLPDQERWRGPELETLPVLTMSLEGLHPDLRARIERAAKFDDQSVEEFIHAAVASRVELAEYNMLFHIQTGEPVNRVDLGVDMGFCEE